jgi:DNA (cytosine-5)-methyltransferase 1
LRRSSYTPLLFVPLRYLDTFSGIGGFALPLEELGHECVGFCEIDPHAIQIYRSHFPSHPCYGDITNLEAGTLPGFDLLVGGFPCQAFSIAGAREGFCDTRGALKEQKARSLGFGDSAKIENVAGLLSHALGYDLQWQLCNSKDFGVPQNRQRVFVVGYRRGTPRPEVFPLAASRAPSRDPGAASLRRCAAVAIRTRNGRPTVEMRRDGLSNALRSSEGGSSRAMIHDGKRIRRLTPLECERLQGFPDGWTEGIADTQRYRCLGNAVTVYVVREIIRRL